MMQRRNYLCPVCFRRYGGDQVLFWRESGRITGADTRRAAVVRAYGGNEAEAGSRVRRTELCDWRDFPASFSRFLDGEVCALKYYDGVEMTEPLCPYCHSLASFPSRKAAYVLSWGMEGMDWTGAVTLLNSAAPVLKDRDAEGLFPEGPSYRAAGLAPSDGAALSGRMLALPVGLDEHSGEYTARFCQEADAVVVRLTLDPAPRQGFAEDLPARRAMEAMETACRTVPGQMHRPLVWILVMEACTGPEEALQQCLEQFHRPLLTAIRSSGARQYLLLTGSGGEIGTEQGTQAVRWLFRQFEESGGNESKN